MTLENKITCVNRFTGQCKKCKEDYDLNHHPNNYDCPNYTAMRVWIIKVKRYKPSEKNI